MYQKLSGGDQATFNRTIEFTDTLGHLNTAIEKTAGLIHTYFSLDLVLAWLA